MRLEDVGVATETKRVKGGLCLDPEGKRDRESHKGRGKQTGRPKARLKRSRDLGMEDLKASRDRTRGDRENRKGQGVAGDYRQTEEDAEDEEEMPRCSHSLHALAEQLFCVQRTPDRSHPEGLGACVQTVLPAKVRGEVSVLPSC